MAKKKKPKITKIGKKITIHLEQKTRVGPGFNPAMKSGAGTHGGTVKEQNRRGRKESKQDLKNWNND